ncbi:MAG: hypothetical protein HYY95_04025, partial [Candidatus Rokubacteria bacterium]|nr:hypothetical protein [Candidatus Rokubacteria bacterium]
MLGVIFLRHAANRFEAATRQIEEDQASGKMPTRKVLPEDYLRRRALWLPESARYDVLMHQGRVLGEDNRAVVRGFEPSVNIDTEWDFLLAELMLREG